MPGLQNPYQPDEAECEFLSIPTTSRPTIYHAGGCSSCKNTGYRGRLGLYEFIRVDEGLRQLIHDRAGDIDLERHARTLSPSILQDGKDKVLSGLTTVEEVLRVYRSY